MEVAAREAATSDVDVVAALAEAAIEELRPQRGGELWYRQSARRAPVTSSIRADLADPGAFVVVGTIDDVVVGYSVVRIEEIGGPRRLGVISDLYAHPDARAVGVGEEMMNMLLTWARSEQCIGVDSIALPGDRQTKNFFESFGLVARAIVVHRSLDDVEYRTSSSRDPRA